MKIQLWALGKQHEAYVDAGVADFTRRISNYYQCAWKIIPPPRNAGLLTANELKKKESESVIKLLSDSDYLVALDENGKMFSSQQLAGFIQQRANEAARQVIFLIGGAYGLDEQVLVRANFKLSLSLLTFPHQLVRLILTEQLYRACTIIRNEKYHHS